MNTLSQFQTISESLDTVKTNLEDLKPGGGPGNISGSVIIPGLLTHITKIQNRLEEYKGYTFDDPRNLASRISRVKAIHQDIKLAKQQGVINPGMEYELKQPILDFLKYMAELEDILNPVLEQLLAIENFFLQNSDNTKYIDRIIQKVQDDNRKSTGFEKVKTKRKVALEYGWSKGVVDGQELSLQRHDHIWQNRLQRDFKGVKNREYINWLKRHKKKGNYPDSTIFNISVFLLEKNKEMLGSTRAKFPQHEPWIAPVTDDGDDSMGRMYFENGKLIGLYTLYDSKESGSTESLAKPGIRKGDHLLFYLELHSFETVVAAENRQLHFPFRRGSLQACETPMSVKYVMRHDHLYMGLTPGNEGRAHAEESKFKSIQAAGAIVADRGTVLVIDNASGHFQPGWKLLEQAVKKIDTENAFGVNALVGIVSGSNIYYFPVPVFLNLAGTNFKQQDSISQQQKRVAGIKIPAVPDNNLDNLLRQRHFLKMDGSQVRAFMANLKEF